MATRYMIVGAFQFDEESGHWNVCGFSDQAAAYEHIRAIKDRIDEFLPKYMAFEAKLRGGRTGINVNDTEYFRLSEKALNTLRKRIGDPGYMPHFAAEIEYSVESVEIYE